MLAIAAHALCVETLLYGVNTDISRLGAVNDRGRYAFCLYGCKQPIGRHVIVREAYSLLRKYQDKEIQLPGMGLQCVLACRACFCKETKPLFTLTRKPSDHELRLYDHVARVFPDDVMSLEHKFPGPHKSVDLMLLQSRIAFQADGCDHTRIHHKDRQYDEWLNSQGISVVRLHCRDVGWGSMVEEARRKWESSRQRVFTLYSPSYPLPSEAELV